MITADKVLAMASKEYFIQRRIAALRRQQNATWMPPPRNAGAKSENWKAYYELGKLLVARRLNPIQAIRRVFEDFAKRELSPPEPKQILKLNVLPDVLQEEAAAVAKATLRSSYAIAARAGLEARLTLNLGDGHAAIDPSLLDDCLDPVVLVQLNQSIGLKTEAPILDSAIREYLFCPVVYQEICGDKLPRSFRDITTYEDMMIKLRT